MRRSDFIVTVTDDYAFVSASRRGVTIMFAFAFALASALLCFFLSACDHRCAADSPCPGRILWLHCMAQYRRQSGPSKKPPDSKKKSKKGKKKKGTSWCYFCGVMSTSGVADWTIS
jgi:L-lactate utilization protein LutB